MATGTTSSDYLQNSSPPRAGGASGTAQQAGQVAREQAGEAWKSAKDTARSTLSEQQRSAAGGLDDFAGALRKAADEMEQGGRQAGAARYAKVAADGLERVAGTLKSKDLDGMIHEAESFARKQPALFFGAAVAAGFLAIRFMKSSRSQPSSGDGGSAQDLSSTTRI
jgi:hypothetical protein